MKILSLGKQLLSFQTRLLTFLRHQWPNLASSFVISRVWIAFTSLRVQRRLDLWPSIPWIFINLSIQLNQFDVVNGNSAGASALYGFFNASFPQERHSMDVVEVDFNGEIVLWPKVILEVNTFENHFLWRFHLFDFLYLFLNENFIIGLYSLSDDFYEVIKELCLVHGIEETQEGAQNFREEIDGQYEYEGVVVREDKELQYDKSTDASCATIMRQEMPMKRQAPPDFWTKYNDDDLWPEDQRIEDDEDRLSKRAMPSNLNLVNYSFVSYVIHEQIRYESIF